MAFDRTNPTDLIALKSEVEVDPISMGYAAVVDQTQQLLKLLNDPANNVGGDTIAADLTPRLLLESIVPGDLDAAQVGAGEIKYLEAFMNRADLDEDINSFKATIRGVFASNSATVSNIDALVSPLSRAEVLFGQGTIISRDDWFAARDYQG